MFKPKKHMTGLFLFGTLWFWLLSVIAFIFIITSLEHRRYGGTGATWVMLLFFGVLYLWGGNTLSSIGEYLSQNPIRSLLYGLGYITTGIVWSFVKWYYFLLNYKEKVDRSYANWRNYIPKASDNKGKIIAWMTYWPMSGVWTIINDPIRRIYDRIYKRIGRVYDKISDRIFKD